MASVSFDDVAKVYPDGTRAVSGYDLDISDGEFMVLVACCQPRLCSAQFVPIREKIRAWSRAESCARIPLMCRGKASSVDLLPAGSRSLG